MRPPTPAAIGRLVAARALKELTESLRRLPAVTASGLWGSSVATVTAAIEQELKRPVLVVCGHVDEADDLGDDLELFHGRRPDVLPALELSGTLGQVSEEQASNRLDLIHRMSEAAGETNGDGAKPPLIVAPIQALMQSVPSRQQVSQLIKTLRVGDELEPEKLIVWLSEHGYNRLEQVEVPGDFAVRGGIVDIYLPGEFEQAGEQVGMTVRVDFFGDQIESIRQFDLDSLGSRLPVESVRVMDVRGQLPDTSGSTHFLSYLPADAVVVLWEPLEIAEQAKSYLDRVPEVQGIYPLAALLRQAERFTRVELSQFEQGPVATVSLLGGQGIPNYRLPIGSLQKFETDANKAIHELAELAKTHDVTVFCENPGEYQRFCELLDQNEPGLRERIAIPIGYLHQGFVWDESIGQEGQAAGVNGAKPIALLGHHELFHRYEQRRQVKKVIASRPVDSFLDLKVGDYVVHVAHGIAKFMGMHTISKDGRAEEYLTLRFAENAALHVPASRINLIQKYIGGFHGHPKLSRLGSGAWEKEKAKVSEAVMDMAAELLDVQAARAAEVGIAYPADTEWQNEFEAEFPYDPTPDQLNGADEIKQDMQKSRPMDRLLCGDVGYGKTELAMRAAFKAVEAGKQVAVLVPTTVLAEQHYRSFRERMVNYPLNIESLSRFKTGKQQKETIKKVAMGEVDIIIGTHRLVSKDVSFADLGLVVVDEEQRFGVTHKERLKQIRRTVDVLTMSATPIPRTLHMSMLGLRDITSLTTAPQDRRSVVTEVIPYDKERVRQAILREMNREGQVYFVHNRVHNIMEIAEQLQQLVPDARIIIGHGQMHEHELEKVMLQFVRHEADILVCTTIIESGLDIPNVNTILINQADRFGLSELHQLRGRVGRWKHRAYCYLLLPADRPITPVAAKRLKAIEEYSHLGAGFKIAMRDLEIRGAGNILGPEQSGHIAAVGYEMYCQLLEEATRQLKNEPKLASPEAHVEIGVSAFIPKQYIPGDRQRMDAYRRLTRCSSMEMVQGLQQDLKDAYGELPRQVNVLIAMTEVRLLAGHYGIESIIRQEPDVVLKMRDAQRVQRALIGAPGTLRVIDDSTLYFRPPTNYLEPEILLMTLRNLMYAAYQRELKGEADPIPKAKASVGKAAGVAETTAPVATKKLPSTAEANATRSLIPELEKLVYLRNQGILTEEEFQAATKRLAAKK
ncbi:MAG TPA: transcription-repair coupling factor [Tepidisphaeraceae bacterium]|nr:transcription-repair coupling factor [Tepidisphaeraceae bacterium]